jgi:hypothetical protein
MQPDRLGRIMAEREDLPHKVELWNEAKEPVAQVLALAACGNIGFAAYYAAGRDFPDRYVTLRHSNRVVLRWDPPGQ